MKPYRMFSMVSERSDKPGRYVSKDYLVHIDRDGNDLSAPILCGTYWLPTIEHARRHFPTLNPHAQNEYFDM